MAKFEDIKVLMLPDYRDNNSEGDVKVDLLFSSENHDELLINSKEDFEDDKIYKKINEFEIKSSENNFFHVNEIVEYLKRNRKGFYRTLNKEICTPNYCFILYKILANNGIITMTIDSDNIIIFTPEKMNKIQKDSLINLSNVLKKFNFYLCVVENINDTKQYDNITYNEVLKCLNIEKNIQKR